MLKGFIKVTSAIPSVHIADAKENLKSICALCKQMDDAGVSVAVFPEMCLTGYTCGDLFHNARLIEDAMSSLMALCAESRNWNLVAIVGLPLKLNNTLYNVAAVVARGSVHGFVPKSYIPNYNEFYEKRWWAKAPEMPIKVSLENQGDVIMSVKQLFKVGDVKFGIEICEDLWTPAPPSGVACLEGADIIFNLSASDALIGKYRYLKSLVSQQSARCIAGYVYASAGFGESSTDLVFDGIGLIAENGSILGERPRWQHEPGFVSADIDVEALRHDRLSHSSFSDCASEIKQDYAVAYIGDTDRPAPFTRKISRTPFIPGDKSTVTERCEEIVNIQTAALAKRLTSTGIKNIVVGISGGLDSTLALLIAVRTFEKLRLPLEGIHAITMPGFGTTGRTHNNAVKLIDELGVTFRDISIVPAVKQHFNDIGHSADIKDVTYENSQARQRTLILMDIANQVGGLVLGTGDMSELALGWATYNGDHMSMYGVNAGVPKTLVKYLVEYFAESEAPFTTIKDENKFREILKDIIATPISPELIPADQNGEIVQKTEDLVGPYELHDFFLYYFLRFGLEPASILERARVAFTDTFDADTITRWLNVFIRRFFTQQFKRSCMPDGPKVGSVCLSPRGDWRMPSDACSQAFRIPESDK